MLSEKSMCCGCEACTAICTCHAIKMVKDKEGFLYPSIDKSLCVKCGLCESVCPMMNREKMQLETHNRKCYAGFLNDWNLLRKSSSGGAATALAQSILKSGGLVFGVSYSNDFKSAEFVKCTTESDLDKIRGTKYIQSRKNEIYLEVKESLDKNAKVLFIGLPCEIAGIKAFLKTEYANLFTCELICHGPTSEKVQKEFIEHLERKYRSKIVNYTVRFKKDGWTPLYVFAEFANGKTYTNRLDKTDFYHAFALFLRPSCYHCVFKGNRRVADITVGDFWGDIEDKEYWNKDGVSAIMIHTTKGEQLFSKISSMSIFEAEYELIRTGNPRIDTCEREIEAKRKKFAEVLSNRGLSIACIRTRSVKRTIKNIVFK